MSKKTIRLIVLIVCIGVIIACVTYFVNDFLQRRKIEQLREEVTNSVSSQTAPKKEVEVPVDFDKLKAANPDIYAWISIPEVNVEYPILQSEDDNAYYLNHTVNGEKSAYGSIYTENYNSKDFSDFNTVIYGHNMKNGTMFGSLKKFRDVPFFEQNRYINVYMPGRILKYEIFAACTWNNKHILASYDFNLEQNCQFYLDDVFAVRDMSSQIKKDIEVTSKDRIISLSTCMNDKSKRFIVSGVLIYDSAED